MSDSGARPFDELLELYLDDRLSADERLEVEGRLAADPQAAELVALQRKLDDKLRRAFRPRGVTPAEVQLWLRDAAGVVSPSGGDADRSPSAGASREVGAGTAGLWRANGRRWMSVAAACLLVLGACWGLWGSLGRGWLRPGGGMEPYFEPRPLTTIYTESVREGFQPYYFCEDEARFAATFAKRQRVPLELAQMPADRRMIGLSYSGGFTRDTTAILCEAQDRPVIVFVDRRDVDRPEVTQPDPACGLYVHRRELGDLVLYEVGPSDIPLVLDYLRLR